MALKSYRLFKKGKKKKKKRTGLGGLVVGGVTALIGIGLLSETAGAVSRV